MVYTVTFNPSLDYIVSVNDFQMGMTNRTCAEQMLPGGKGINVSTVLYNLGIETKHLVFQQVLQVRRLSAEWQRSGFTHDFISLPEGCSRINIKLKDFDGTEINGMGPDISPENVESLMQKLDTLTSEDYLVLAGSIPGSMPKMIYRDIMARLASKGVQFVVDATGELLMNVLEYHPFLIKPNNHELGEIFGVELKTRDEVQPYAKKLQEMGARNVLVSMAGQGAVLLDENGGFHQLPAPKGTLVNAVGAGDSMVAGFVAGWIEKQDYEHAFRMGISAGSASAFSELLATEAEIRQVYGIHRGIRNS